MDYADLKTLHQVAVVVSVGGFFVRGVAAFVQAPWVRSRTARTLPHMVDTLLLASALLMVWMLRLNPLTTPWLAAKIIALLCYIGLGLLALRPGRPLAVRVAAWLAALGCVAYIVAVALRKNPFPWG